MMVTGRAGLAPGALRHMFHMHRVPFRRSGPPRSQAEGQDGAGFPERACKLDAGAERLFGLERDMGLGAAKVVRGLGGVVKGRG